MKTLAVIIMLASSEPMLDRFFVPPETGAAFLRECDKRSLFNRCVPYVRAVYEGALAAYASKNTKGICPSSPVTAIELFHTGLDYIKSAPQHADQIPAALLVHAWRRKFPCTNEEAAPR